MDSSTGPVQNDASIRAHAVRRIHPRSGKDPRSEREFEQELERGAQDKKRPAKERDETSTEKPTPGGPSHPSGDDDVGSQIDVTC